jgi:UDPglucose 6-dehydrogenase
MAKASSSVGIIGVGFVGGALKKYFETRKQKLFVYDKFKNLGSAKEVNKAEVIFVCVPTPYIPNKGFDLSAVKSALKIVLPGKVVVIKSTVLPGSTIDLQKQFPKLKVMFNPEFLREKYAYEDLVKPDRQLLGVTSKSKSSATKVMKLLPRAPYEKVMNAEETEMVKYMANAFLALKVVYANEFFDIAKKLKVDYKAVKEAVVKDLRIGDSHFDVYDSGYRGYGGSCFPKDVSAIIQLAEKKGVKPKLLKSMREINQKLLKQSGLDENYFLTEKHKKK